MSRVLITEISLSLCPFSFFPLIVRQARPPFFSLWRSRGRRRRSRRFRRRRKRVVFFFSLFSFPSRIGGVSFFFFFLGRQRVSTFLGSSRACSFSFLFLFFAPVAENHFSLPFPPLGAFDRRQWWLRGHLPTNAGKGSPLFFFPLSRRSPTPVAFLFFFPSLFARRRVGEVHSGRKIPAAVTEGGPLPFSSPPLPFFLLRHELVLSFLPPPFSWRRLRKRRREVGAAARSLSPFLFSSSFSTRNWDIFLPLFFFSSPIRGKNLPASPQSGSKRPQFPSLFLLLSLSRAFRKKLFSIPPFAVDIYLGSARAPVTPLLLSFFSAGGKVISFFSLPPRGLGGASGSFLRFKTRRLLFPSPPPDTHGVVHAFLFFFPDTFPPSAPRGPPFSTVTIRRPFSLFFFTLGPKKAFYVSNPRGRGPFSPFFPGPPSSSSLPPGG